MSRYIGIEIGVSVYSEFKMKDEEFHETCDGIFLGEVKAKDEDEAYKKIKRLEWNKGRNIDKVVIYKIKQEY